MMQHLLRHRTLNRAALCAAIVLSTAVALAQDGRDLRESAYCVGVLRHTKDMVARLGTPSDAQKQAGQLAQRSAVVRTSIGKHDIDAVTTRQLIALGRADAELCWDQMDMCFDGGSADLEACMQPVKQTCLKTSVCNR